MASYQSIPTGICITTNSANGTNNVGISSTKYSCYISNGEYNVMENVFPSTGDCTFNMPIFIYLIN
jgi:hypothetical protein